MWWKTCSLQLGLSNEGFWLPFPVGWLGFCIVLSLLRGLKWNHLHPRKRSKEQTYAYTVYVKKTKCDCQVQFLLIATCIQPASTGCHTFFSLSPLLAFWPLLNYSCSYGTHMDEQLCIRKTAVKRKGNEIAILLFLALHFWAGELANSGSPNYIKYSSINTRKPT